MNAIQLFLQDGRPADVWACGECRIVKRQKSEADECCDPKKLLCDKCGVNQKRTYRTTCDDCDALHWKEVEAARFEKAEKVTSWDGWVYVDGVGYKDGFFENTEDLLDFLADENEEGGKGDREITYAWTCGPSHFAHVGIDSILDRICDDGDAYEDFDSVDLHGVKELEAALDIFNEKNKEICSYQPDYERAVLIAKTEGGEGK